MGKLLLILLLLGFLLGLRMFLFFGATEVVPENTTLTITTTLLTDPKPQGNRQAFSIVTSQGARIFVTVPRFPSFHYGQTLKLTGRIKRVELENGAVLSRMDFPNVTVVKDYANPLFSFADFFRRHVSFVFSQTLTYPYSALLIGIVFGVREGMPRGLTDALSQTGVIHITAASGMNITMLAGALFFILAGFLERKGAILVSVLVIWLYATISGFDASITRASLMATIAFSAGLLGRQTIGWYCLVLTGFLMLFVDPQTVLDIGFQLSFASTAGILLLVPLIGKKEGEKDSSKEAVWFLADDFKTTIAAQLATIPILLTQFGTYSPFSILVNLLILWTIPVLMVLGAFAALVSFILPLLSVPFLYLALPLLWYIEQIVLLSSAFLPSFSFSSFPLSLSIGYYLLLLSVAALSFRRRND